MINQHEIVSPQLAIKAMRSSGFKNTDRAIAELIDNSIQAGLTTNSDFTQVEVLCIESTVTGRRRGKRITEIVVCDNATGMSPDLLQNSLMFGQGTNLTPNRQKGIGKFGMGLPNASISQCKTVEVYSWQNNQCFFTYLSIDEIEQGIMRDVPQPQMKELPKKYVDMLDLKPSSSGTMVVWRDLDRVTWARHKAFFSNSEFLIGLIYRRFIADEKVKIRFAACYETNSGRLELQHEMFVKPNDPMMLMEGTAAPEPYSKEAAFEEQKSDEVWIDLPEGGKSLVNLRFSVAKNEVRRKTGGGRAAGDTTIGKYVAKNLGVSVVRAGRELEMNRTWDNPSDPTERWWCVEIEFQPELDDILGVTNDKQAATKLYHANMQDDAKRENYRMSSELKEDLMEADDLSRLANYDINRRILARLTSLRAHVKAQNASAAKASGLDKTVAEQAATRAAKIRGEKKATPTDLVFQTKSEEEKTKALTGALTDDGYDAKDAEDIATATVKAGDKFVFNNIALTSSAIFDVSPIEGINHIRLNTNHPIYEQLKNLVEEQKEEESPALIGLKLLLMAWARMEDETDGVDRETVQDLRASWGQIAREFARQLDFG